MLFLLKDGTCLRCDHSVDTGDNLSVSIVIRTAEVDRSAMVAANYFI
jgi:hypothetical protein